MLQHFCVLPAHPCGEREQRGRCTHGESAGTRSRLGVRTAHLEAGGPGEAGGAGAASQEELQGEGGEAVPPVETAWAGGPPLVPDRGPQQVAVEAPGPPGPQGLYIHVLPFTFLTLFESTYMYENYTIALKDLSLAHHASREFCIQATLQVSSSITQRK